MIGAVDGWPVSPQRRAVLSEVAQAVPVFRDAPVRVAVDGVDGAGKTVFANQLGQVLAATRPVIRASVDGFHRPSADRYRRGRTSPVGFWLDSYDYNQLRAELLDPLSPGGSRSYRTAVHDVATDEQVDQPARRCPAGAVLVLDGVFLHRDELGAYWDFSVWLDVPFTITAARMASRDGTSPDPEDPSLARYVGGQRLYLAQCRPSQRANIVIDNAHPDRPSVLPPSQ